METLLRSMDFDDRFTLEFLWRKESKEPFRARLTFALPDLHESSFELPVGAVLEMLGLALRDADRLCVQEFTSSLAPLFQRYASDGNTPEKNSFNPNGKADSA